MAFLFAVNVCQCSSEKSCYIKLQHENSKPSVGQAIGILLGVLLVIGRWLLSWYEARSLRWCCCISDTDSLLWWTDFVNVVELVKKQRSHIWDHDQCKLQMFWSSGYLSLDCASAHTYNVTASSYNKRKCCTVVHCDSTANYHLFPVREWIETPSWAFRL